MFAGSFAILLLGIGAAIADNRAFIEGQGVHLPSGDTDPCPPSTLSQNHDGSTEFAFTWEGPGVQEPDYGALAEGYPELAAGTVCGIQLYLTRWGTMNGSGSVDLFVWEYDAGSGNPDPGAVLSVSSGVAVSGVSLWPGVSTHDLDVADAGVPAGGVFVGYWPRSFLEAPAQFGCAVDLNGPGGAPRTHVAPGIGYPTGWAHPSEVGLPPLRAFGIGAWVSIEVTPATETSWSRIKALLVPGPK